MRHPTFYRTTRIDELSIFYREAGPKDAPALLLLHGLPSSSRMFEPLFARLSDRYSEVAGLDARDAAAPAGDLGKA
jgi:pimeloyl-ACP methyl ester carboxylesterase